MLDRVGLPKAVDCSTDALSGGEAQRLMVAAALAGGASLLLLDEPLAHLDPNGAHDLVSLLARLAGEGVAILLVEHRMPLLLLQSVSRVLVMDQGEVVSDRPAHDLDLGLIRGLGLRLPGLMDLADRLGALPQPGQRSLTPEPVPPSVAPSEAPSPTAALAALDGVSFQYPRAVTWALEGLTVSVQSGDRIAILGGNGAGKSTLLACLSGALPSSGVSVAGRCVRVPQDPDLSLFCETVEAELAYAPGEARLPATERADLVTATADALSVRGSLAAAPHALSRGQRLRVAVAAALTCRPDLLLLDEPTAGQDHDQVERMMAALGGEHGPPALLFATHDIELALRHATRVWVLERGRLVLDASPRDAAQQLASFEGLTLPPLSAWCIESGLPFGTAEQLHRALVNREIPASEEP
jgi:energy-coupling factor transport system ATP-binding protein